MSEVSGPAGPIVLAIPVAAFAIGVVLVVAPLLIARLLTIALLLAFGVAVIVGGLPVSPSASAELSLLLPRLPVGLILRFLRVRILLSLVLTSSLLFHD